MKIIAVTGGSGCGKTFFTNLLVERFQKKTAVLPLDCYYKDRPDQIPNDKYDFDSPRAFDFDLYHKHLNLLTSGESVQMPHFGYENGKRETGFTEIIPEEYLVIEGLHVLFLSKIRELVSFSFFMDSPLEVAVCRRCIRDRYLTVMDIANELESSETRELDALRDRSVFMGAEEK